MNAALAMPRRGASPTLARALPTARTVVPQRASPVAGAAGSAFKVLRTNRVPQQLSLFEQPRAGR